MANATGLTPDDDYHLTATFFHYFVTQIVMPVMPRSGKGLVYDLYSFFSHSGRIRRMLRENWLLPVFKDRFVTPYDLLCDHIHLIVRRDDLFYRRLCRYSACLAKIRSQMGL